MSSLVTSFHNFIPHSVFFNHLPFTFMGKPYSQHIWILRIWNICPKPLLQFEEKFLLKLTHNNWINYVFTLAILWPPDVRNWLIWKEPDTGKDWRWEKKEMTEDEMVGWHHQLNGPEFEQTPGVGDKQESLACCSPWGHKELDTIEQMNWTDFLFKVRYF